MFGRQLRLIRPAATGTPHQELAARVGCDRTLVGTVERGETNISYLSADNSNGQRQFHLPRWQALRLISAEEGPGELVCQS